MTTTQVLAESSPRYALSQRLLHWLTALLVFLALAAGLTLGQLGFAGARETFGLPMTNFLYITHKTLGVLLLGLILLRLGLRLGLGKPAYEPALPAWQRTLSGGVHLLLYLLLLGMPLLGWAATAAGGFPINFFHWELPPLLGRNRELAEQLFYWHGVVGWTLLAVIGLHIAAAVYHWRIKRDTVMRRMSLWS